MILYFPANNVPKVSFLTGIGRVAVVETDISSEGGSGVVHSLQYLESEGFSVLHLGHFIVPTVHADELSKRIAIQGGSVNLKKTHLYKTSKI